MQQLYNMQRQGPWSFGYSLILHAFVILITLEISLLFKAQLQAKVMRLNPITLELLSVAEVPAEALDTAFTEANIEGNATLTREKMISKIVLGQIEGMSTELNIKRIDVELVITREGRLIDFNFDLMPPSQVLEQQLIQLFSSSDIVFPKGDGSKPHQTYRLAVLGQ